MLCSFLAQRGLQRGCSPAEFEMQGYQPPMMLLSKFLPGPWQMLRQNPGNRRCFLMEHFGRS